MQELTLLGTSVQSNAVQNNYSASLNFVKADVAAELLYWIALDCTGVN